MMVDTKKVRAIDIAKLFIKKGLDYPRNTLDGNMKLQKLVYFSQLIHLAKYGKPLFDDPIYAFKHGSVIENVRQAYQYNNNWLVNESMKFEEDLIEEEKESIELTERIFGNLTANELSELNHQQFSWKSSYDRSVDDFFDYHHKEASIIDIERIIEHDIEKVQQLLLAFEVSKESKKHFIVINSITFYFEPDQTVLNDEILSELEEFTHDCTESIYTFYFDENLGLVIF